MSNKFSSKYLTKERLLGVFHYMGLIGSHDSKYPEAYRLIRKLKGLTAQEKLELYLTVHTGLLYQKKGDSDLDTLFARYELWLDETVFVNEFDGCDPNEVYNGEITLQGIRADIEDTRGMFNEVYLCSVGDSIEVIHGDECVMLDPSDSVYLGEYLQPNVGDIEFSDRVLSYATMDKYLGGVV